MKEKPLKTFLDLVEKVEKEVMKNGEEKAQGVYVSSHFEYHLMVVRREDADFTLLDSKGEGDVVQTSSDG